MNIQNIHVRATELYTQSFAEFGVGFAPPTLTVAQVRAVLQALVELDEPEEAAAQPEPKPQPTADKPKRKLPRNTSPEHMQRMREARMAKRQQRLQQEAPAAPSLEPATEGPTAEPEGESR